MRNLFGSASRRARAVYFVLAWCVSGAVGWSLAFLCLYLVRGPSTAMAGLHNFIVTFEFVMMVSGFMLMGMYAAHLAEIPLRRRFPKAAPYVAITSVVMPFTALGLWVAIVVLR